MGRVAFIDTSVLCELVEVPGRNRIGAEIREELRRRSEQGERFLVPVTTVIETGNHIAQAKTGDRYAAAQRFVGLLQAVVNGDRSFLLHRLSWDGAFLQALCEGGTTGRTFSEWAAVSRKDREGMGGGDVAILVERDRFIQQSSFSRADVGIWTLEPVLRAYA